MRLRVAAWVSAISIVGAAGCASEGGAPSLTADASDGAGSSTGASTVGPASTTVSGTADDRGEPTTGSIDSSSGDDDGDADASGSTGAASSGPRYHEVQQKSAHNAYQRDEAILDQIIYHRVRSIELDIHVGKALQPTLDGEWYVYHTDVVDDATWCVHLGDCLGELAALEQVLAQHEIVTLWVDLKDAWDDTHGHDQLDARLQAALGDALLTPAELLARCPGASDLQGALLDDRCGWPELEDIRGRVLVVLTGGSGNLRSYHDDDSRPRAALVAPAIASLADASQWPGTSVFNFAAADVALAGEVAAAGHVVRVWGNNDEVAWQAAIDAQAHHVATDKVSYHEDPWASTHDAQGWPFRCLGACASIGPEPGTVIGIDVDSGDVWDTADSAWFLHDDLADDPDHSWRTLVSTANSHVEPFAKGCLMARADLDAGAPYFAVCRPADAEPVRVQWRADGGGTSLAIEADIVAPDTVDAPAVAFVRLRVSQGGTCVAGDGSLDGTTWVEIGSHCFDVPLPLQGIAASSHDAGLVRVLFVEPRRDDGPARTRADFAASAALADASAVVYDGVMP
jgi:hypothetical protein